MQIKSFFAFLSLICAVFFFSFTHTVHAQEGAGITLIPAMIEAAANPGDIVSKTVKITNESKTDKEYYIFKKNIKGVDVGGVPLFVKDDAEKTGYELVDWLEVPTEPVTVPAESSIELPLTIQVPSNASPGSHFGAVFVSVEAPHLRTIGAGVGYEVTSVISIRISGDVIDTARIRSFSTDKLLYGSKHVNFTARVENQGNILIRPHGSVEIRGMFGRKPEVFNVNDNLSGVFPGTMRDLTFSWDGDGLGFGRYEAVLALVYDGDTGQKTIDASLVFWVFPIKVMLAVLAGIVLVTVAGYGLTRYYINQAIIRAAGSRRVMPQRYRKQVGISRFAFVFTAVMAAVVLFLLVLLIFSA